MTPQQPVLSPSPPLSLPLSLSLPPLPLLSLVSFSPRTDRRHYSFARRRIATTHLYSQSTFYRSTIPPTIPPTTPPTICPTSAFCMGNEGSRYDPHKKQEHFLTPPFDTLDTPSRHPLSTPPLNKPSLHPLLTHPLDHHH